MTIEVNKDSTLIQNCAKGYEIIKFERFYLSLCTSSLLLLLGVVAASNGGISVNFNDVVALYRNGRTAAAVRQCI